MRSAIRLLRGATSTLLFAVFGLGSLVLSPLVAMLPRPEWGQCLVRGAWKPLVFAFEALGLISVERGNLRTLRGTVITANHPSLIDVVLLTVLMPHTLCVAKHALKHNPFMFVLARRTTLPDDVCLLDAARASLAKGWNVLIFPEGTRSPSHGLQPFHRGAVQLALRTSAPLVAVGIRQSERILGKRQRPWQLGAHRVTYAFRMDAPRQITQRDGETVPRAARRHTAELESRIRSLMSPVVPRVSRTPPHAAVVIPVYNPEPDLEPLCKCLARHFDRIVVVDDGSVEHRERFEPLSALKNLTLLRHDVNQGKGCAIKTALAALPSTVKTVVFADGDGQHRPEDILNVAWRAHCDDAVAFGVRDFGAKGVPFRSWWGNRWTALEVKILFGYRLSDTQTGLRAFPARLLQDVAALKGNRYEFEARIFRFLAQRGEPIVQEPIATIYRAANRVSHFRPFVDTLRTQAALFAPC